MVFQSWTSSLAQKGYLLLFCGSPWVLYPQSKVTECRWCGSVTVSAGPSVALTKLAQEETAMGPVICEDRVLGVDEPSLPALLGRHSLLGQVP